MASWRIQLKESSQYRTLILFFKVYLLHPLGVWHQLSIVIERRDLIRGAKALRNRKTCVSDVKIGPYVLHG